MEIKRNVVKLVIFFKFLFNYYYISKNKETYNF